MLTSFIACMKYELFNRGHEPSNAANRRRCSVRGPYECDIEQGAYSSGRRYQSRISGIQVLNRGSEADA